MYTFGMENVMTFLPSVAWVLAAASLLFTTLLGLTLAYHWFRYAFAPFVSGVTLTVYIAVSVTLLSGMFAALAILDASI